MIQVKEVLKGHGDKLFYLYYIIVFLFYCLNVFFSFVRPGVFTSILIIILSIYAMPSKLNMIDFVILMYLLYNLISIIYNIQNNMPLSVGIKEFTSSALPIMFYFIGKKFIGKREAFYKYFLYACFFCYTIGMIWYITLPSYYINYQTRLNPLFNLDAYLLDKRFLSFLGSTSIGILAPISAIIAYYFLQKTKQYRYLLMFCYSILISFLSHQRASYLMILVAIILLQIKFFRNPITIKIMIFEIVAVMGCFTLILFGSSDTLINIFSVFKRFGSAISSRQGQWLTVLDIGDRIILGNGLGSMSHRAIGYSTKLINDGAYFKLLGELGLVGFVLLFFILLTAFYRLFVKKYSHQFMMEATIILMFLIQSLGSNNLFFQETAPLFWISLGFVFSVKTSELKPEQNMLKENIHNEDTSIVLTSIS